ncbi:hypothetical protein LEL_03290 [Akanthomyces lecanii RCEF 1005]|uniref:Uncharacterized protein n=1 Tax=Akanthomyces lecanii RCEF 1005 TaxID=1081108 RepID=A0A168IYF1_CORDF|nr:hypothetical protein LEL_03290 [Akanthomyces lecanii RCEF 1005]
MDHTIHCASAIAFLEGRHRLPLPRNAHDITLPNLSRRLLAIEHKLDDVPTPSPFEVSTWNGMVWRLWRIQAKHAETPIIREKLDLMAGEAAEDELRVTRLEGLLDTLSADLPEIRCPREAEEQQGEEGGEECEACARVIVQKLAYLGGSHKFFAPFVGSYSKRYIYAYAASLSIGINVSRAAAKPPLCPWPSRGTMDGCYAGYPDSTARPEPYPKAPPPPGPAVPSRSPSERGRRRAWVQSLTDRGASPRASGDAGYGFDNVCQKPGCMHEILREARCQRPVTNHHVSRAPQYRRRVPRTAARDDAEFLDHDIFEEQEARRRREGRLNENTLQGDTMIQNGHTGANFDQDYTNQSALNNEYDSALKQNAPHGTGRRSCIFNRNVPQGDALRYDAAHEHECYGHTLNHNASQGAGRQSGIFKNNVTQEARRQSGIYNHNVPQGEALRDDAVQEHEYHRGTCDCNAYQGAALDQDVSPGAAFNQSSSHAATFDDNFPEGDDFNQDIAQASGLEFNTLNRDPSETEAAFLVNISEQAGSGPAGNGASGVGLLVDEPSAASNISEMLSRRRPVGVGRDAHAGFVSPASKPSSLVPKPSPAAARVSPAPEASQGPTSDKSAWVKKVKFWRSKKARSGGRASV